MGDGALGVDALQHRRGRGGGERRGRVGRDRDARPPVRAARSAISTTSRNSPDEETARTASPGRQRNAPRRRPRTGPRRSAGRGRRSRAPRARARGRRSTRRRCRRRRCAARGPPQQPRRLGDPVRRVDRGGQSAAGPSRRSRHRPVSRKLTDRTVPLRDQKGPDGLTLRPQGWNSRSLHAPAPCVPAALSPRVPADRGGDRERRVAPGRAAALRAMASATSSGVSRATVRRALEELVADGLVETRGPGVVRGGRGARGASERADEPVGARPLARPDRVGPRARARGPAGDDRRGRGLPDRARRRAARPPARCACSTACRSRWTTTGCRCASCPTPRTSTSHRPRCTTRSSAMATRPPAPTTRSRRGRRRTARRRCWGWSPARRCSSRRRSPSREDGRIVDMGRTVYRADRYRFQATLTRRLQREREGTNESSMAQRGRAGRRWRSSSPPAAGRQARRSPRRRRVSRRRRTSRPTASTASGPSRCAW